MNFNDTKIGVHGSQITYLSKVDELWLQTSHISVCYLTGINYLEQESLYLILIDRSVKLQEYNTAMVPGYRYC